MKKWLMALFGLAAGGALAVQVNEAAPEFKAKATNDKEIALSDLKGKWVVLYFYPKAFTPGCTKQACSLRDGHETFEKLNAVVLGCSFDSVEKLKDFKKEYKLPFDLLSDADKKIATAYDVVGMGGLVPKRVSFIIGPDGKLASIVREIDVGKHDQQIKAELEKLQKK